MVTMLWSGLRDDEATVEQRTVAMTTTTMMTTTMMDINVGMNNKFRARRMMGLNNMMINMVNCNRRMNNTTINMKNIDMRMRLRMSMHDYRMLYIDMRARMLVVATRDIDLHRGLVRRNQVEMRSRIMQYERFGTTTSNHE